MSSTSYTPEKKTLGDALSDKKFPIRVPDYQRDFSWRAKEVTDFWEDLLGFDKKYPKPDGNAGYFLGTVVMVKNGDHLLVLDGQQRFATATILLALFRDNLRSRANDENDANDSAEYIQNTFISGQDRLDPSQPKTYRLELNVADREFFKRVVQDEGFEDSKLRPSHRSHKLILGARRRLRGLIDELLAGEKTEEARVGRLLRLSGAITKHFGIVAIISDDHDQAASIFETLNERGLSLSTSDLLRSWLLANPRPLSSRSEVVNLWTRIAETHGERNVDGMIRSSWVSTHGDVKTRALYKEIKDDLTSSKTSAVEYSRNLERDASYLKSLHKGRTGVDAVDQAARDLSDVKATSSFPALLAAHNSLQAEECCKLARALICLALRHNVICGLEPGKFESAAYGCAKAISDDRQLESGLRILRALSPSNDEVSRKLNRLAFPPKRNKAARVVLTALETSRHSTGELRVVASGAKVQVEHIYPQKPPSGKRLPQHDKLVYMLGNLTLIAGPLNRQGSNHLYVKKKKSYLASELEITKELPKKHVKWGRAPILARQKRLAREIGKFLPQDLV
ncbi:MAG: DUF262 domain-containing HNH endonuclease family protein [Planctomycetota bacterium]